MIEKIDLGISVVHGLSRGIMEVFIKPAADDMLKWAARKIIPVSLPTDQEVADHIQQVIRDS